jgi:hypothetical protein
MSWANIDIQGGQFQANPIANRQWHSKTRRNMKIAKTCFPRRLAPRKVASVLLDNGMNMPSDPSAHAPAQGPARQCRPDGFLSQFLFLPLEKAVRG